MASVFMPSCRGTSVWVTCPSGPAIRAVLTVTRCFHAAAIPGPAAATRSRDDGVPGRARTGRPGRGTGAAAWHGRPQTGVPAGSRRSGRGPAGRRWGNGRPAAPTLSCPGVLNARTVGGAAAGSSPARAAAGRSTGWWQPPAASDVEQLQAVADGDSATAPPLAARWRDPAQRQPWWSALAGSVRQSAASAANPAGSRLRAISAARPFGVAGVSSQARLGRMTSPQISGEHAAAQGETVGPGVRRPGRAAASQDRPAPPRQVARGVGAAGEPPVLPGVTGLIFQPVQHPDQADGAAGLQLVPAGGERRREQPRQYVAAPLAGRRPAAVGAGRGGNRRNSPAIWLSGPSPAMTAAAPRRLRSAAACAPPSRWSSPGLPNSTSSDSGRYRSPGGGPAPGAAAAPAATRA